ncbi:MAG: hypothetical protein RL033_102 [Pseudomonadota bacterium]
MLSHERIDEDVELSAERETNDLRLLRELLEMVRAGTYVMTYNGCGIRMPANYRPPMAASGIER